MIVNIAAYHFTVIDDPPQLARQLREQAESLQLRGTALVAGEGINLFLAGPAAAIETLLDGLRADPRFQALAVKYSHSQAQPFARLKVKVKREIIAFRRDQASPLQERAPTVTPDTLERWLDRGVDDDGRRVVLLDTRNREEVGYGSFEHALTLPIDNFTELPEALAPHREALRDATVVSFCTGGIRCEKAALWLRADGMDNLLQLDGGILGYFERVGGKHYQGHCFVFDERVALDPQLRPLRDAAA
ncbi:MULTISPECIES: sulfurtransferase [Lysobacter]|uniref:sulfurtransferase n=1 Tax=Lysobacter TaxID=68 RepID=UPI001F217B28|nr:MULTISPECIES: sulfurtransferase [Lysobacter]UJB17185.1 sulfurtransferase [Lysobacter capsici]UJQ29092.1 sulfurtransferase [Lysobacter gummosus]